MGIFELFPSLVIMLQLIGFYILTSFHILPVYLSDGAPEMEFLGQSVNGYDFARYWQNPDQFISVPIFPV